MSGSTPANPAAPSFASPGFSSPQEEALLTLFRTADTLEHELHLRLKPYGITAPQYNVLRILRAAEAEPTSRHQTNANDPDQKRSTLKRLGPKHPELKGLMCSAIGRLMITPEPDITRLLARLKAHKLVTQKRDSRDGRVVLTYLAPAGAELLAKLDSIIGETPAELMRGLTAAEVRELTRLLIKARHCSSGKKEDGRPDVTGQPSSPHSPRWSLPRHRPE